MLTSEPNYLRKSHRVDLPLWVRIGEETYRAHDWSLTGVGIQDFQLNATADQVFEATLQLPMPDAQLDLWVQLQFKRHHGDIAGFEFYQLGQKARSILRHYIELAVEGKLGNVEDLVAVVTAPEVATPIQDALNLSELEEETLVSRFRLRSTLSIVTGLVFLLLLVATLFYNTTYRVAATGIVTGNLRKVSAGVNGLVTRLLVHQNQVLQTGQPLLTVRDEQYDSQIASLEQRQQQLQQQLAERENTSQTGKKRILEQLRAFAEIRKAELDRARSLYEQRLISFKDLNYVENQYRQALLNLTREQENTRGSTQASLAEAEPTRKALTEVNQRLQELRAKGAERQIPSPTSGTVFNLPVEPGQRVTAGSTVAVIQADRTPFILIRLLNADAIKLQPGMSANVVAPLLNREYQATVDAIGYTAVNSEVSFSQEASLNETLVKLTFNNPDVRLPANLRVKIWIQTFTWPDWLF